MLGHSVTVRLIAPNESVSGELRKHDVEGVWIYGGWAEQAKTRFYPTHRIVSMEDNGYVHR